VTLERRKLNELGLHVHGYTLFAYRSNGDQGRLRLVELANPGVVVGLDGTVKQTLPAQHPWYSVTKFRGTFGAKTRETIGVRQESDQEPRVPLSVPSQNLSPPIFSQRMSRADPLRGVARNPRDVAGGSRFRHARIGAGLFNARVALWAAAVLFCGRSRSPNALFGRDSPDCLTTAC